MAKRSYKRPAESETHNPGCMWALINLFDFRQGPRTLKLLSDKKPGSSSQGGNGYSKIKRGMHSSYGGKYEDANKAVETKPQRAEYCNASVKALMEEEMFQKCSEKKILNDEAQLTVFNFGHGTHSKNNSRQGSKRCNVISDTHVKYQTGLASSDDLQSDNITLIEKSSLNFDLAAFLMEFYTDNKPCQEMHADCDNKIDLCFAMKAIVQKMTDHPVEFDFRLDRKESILYKALGDMFEAIANQKFVDEKHIVDKATQSKEFMDALEILNSNKEVVLKLLEDPNSHFYKHIQDVQKTQVGKLTKFQSEEHAGKSQRLREDNISSRKDDELDPNALSQKKNRHSFFWNKDKSKAAKSSKQSQNSETINRIVVLKPSPIRTQEHEILTTTSFSPVSLNKISHREDESGRVVSYFSLRDIRRKLKHIIGGSTKERRVISMDGVLHKIPIGYKVSGGKDKLLDEGVVTGLENKSSCDMEESSEVLPIAKEKENKVNPGEGELNNRNSNSAVKPASLIYKEGRKHLADILDIGDKTASLPIGHVSKSLGKLLSMPEFDVLSPRVSCGSVKELVLPSEETGSRSLQQFNQEVATSSQNLEVLSCSISNQTVDVQMLGLKTELADNHMQKELCIVSDLNHEGIVENVEIIEIISEVLPNQLDVPLEPHSNEFNGVCERCHEDLGSLQLELHSVTQSELSPVTSLRENLEAPESIIGKPGRSSPVCILEKFISEEFSSPKFRAIELSRIPALDTRVNLWTSFEDRQARFKYVEAVLKASGLSLIDFSERWHLADKLLEPSLFDEVEISCCPQIDDPKLLFDCIDEALEEIQAKFFKCTPWVSLLTCSVPQVPIGRSLSKEVSRRIERHIPVHLPNTVDHIVKNYLEYGSWMDIQFETDNIVVEIWDTALDDLVEETIFDLWLELSNNW